MSSRKGGRYEREIAKQLSLWLTNDDSNSELIRSVSSGGWKFRKNRQVGDLAPNGPKGDEFRSLFGIECKNREDFSWKHYWTSEDPQLFKWWRQVAEECEDAELIPMLIYRKNYVPDLIGLEEDYWVPLLCEKNIATVSDRILRIKVDDYRVFFMKFDEFLETFSPEIVMGVARKCLNQPM